MFELGPLLSLFPPLLHLEYFLWLSSFATLSLLFRDSAYPFGVLSWIFQIRQQDIGFIDRSHRPSV